MDETLLKDLFLLGRSAWGDLGITLVHRLAEIDRNRVAAALSKLSDKVPDKQ